MIAALGTIVALLLALVVYLLPPSEGLQLRRRRHDLVAVTTKAGDTYRGVLWSADRRIVVLRNVEQLMAEGARLGVDGELLIPSAEIAYMQRP